MKFQPCDLDPMVVFKQYVETALWSTTDDNDEPFDKNYSREDLSSRAYLSMLTDVVNFLEFVQELEISFDHTHEDWGSNEIAEMVGHDFWLTRNGHGAGFWDGDWKNGYALTEAAKSFGGIDLYVGDDGKIYQF